VDHSVGWFITIVVIGALVFLKWYKVPKKPKQKQRRPLPSPPEPPAPQGPTAPKGIQAPARRAPMGGRFGPQYLTGQIRQESEDALALINTYLDPKRRGEWVKYGWAESDWPIVLGAAADFLGAMRWYHKLFPAFNDYMLQIGLLHDMFEIIANRMENYRKSAPPGPDRDQALRILGWFMNQMTTDRETFAHEATFLAIAALHEKTKRNKRRNADGRLTPVIHDGLECRSLLILA
jgi:hypothetical protein